MAKFLMMGKYSIDAMKGISSARTKKGVNAIKKAGGKVESIYALMGAHDIAIMADFADVAKAMKASIELSKMTGIAFTTSPAVKVDAFD
ncbi:MAG: GYD domain-containing protein, partial [Candidatus Omnitrophica bacterium]|nr:GYD domain-containing protein [Candidatus Omnitrophota bacterium]